MTLDHLENTGEGTEFRVINSKAIG